MANLWIGKHRVSDALFLFFGGLLVAMVGLSDGFGITWDEIHQERRGRIVLEHYQSGFKSTVDQRGTAYYGSFFELLCTILQRGFSDTSPHLVRHRLTAFFGWLAILMCTLLSMRMFGGRAAMIAIAFIILSPRFIGHSMSNSKDIPFAALFMTSIYMLSWFKSPYPFSSWRTLLIASALTGFTIAVRSMGILLWLYCALLHVILLWWHRKILTGTQKLKTVARVVVFIVFSWIVAIPFWPSLISSPVARLKTSIQVISTMAQPIFVLFNGQYLKAVDVPWYYLPTWVGITTPVIVLFGLLIALVMFRGEMRFRFTGLFLVVLIPLSAILAGRVPLYDGWRHALFIYPPLVVISAGAWALLMESTRKKSSVLYHLVLGLLVWGLSEPFFFQLRNHPNEVVYFNQWVGGVRGAYGRFDLDSWGNSFKQLLDWLENEASREGKVVRVRVGFPHQRGLSSPSENILTFQGVSPEDSTIMYTQTLKHVKYVSYHYDTDCYLMLGRGSADYLRALEEVGKTIYAVTVDGVPISHIKKF